MRDYKWLHAFCLNRFGSAAALEARLPQPKSDAELRAEIEALKGTAQPGA